MTTSSKERPALTETAELRRRARQQVLEGPVTADYGLDPKQVIDMLQGALATEWVCALRYRRHYYVSRGIKARHAAQEFLEHADQELEHAHQIAERITQLGGDPDLDPTGLAERSHAQYHAGTELKEMITENLIAERIAIESYREIVQFLGERDPTTRRMFEGILAVEEEHADDLVDLLGDGAAPAGR